MSRLHTRTLLPRPLTQACRIGLLGALVLAALPVGPALAGTAPFAVTLSVTAATVSGSPTVTVRLRSAPGAGCALEVAAAGARRSFPEHGTGPSGGTAWRWRWRPGTLTADVPWRFTATCRIGTLWSRRWVSFEPGFPAAGGALAPPRSVAPGTPGASCDGQGLCFAGDPFPAGQCTWYAAGRRPDLLGIVSGNAGSWLAAARGHVPEGWYPIAGALAVWLPFHAGADADGHVAYVAAVSPDGRILVDDSNWRLTPSSPGLEVHEHWVTSISPSGYIYGGPAGPGPAS